MESSARPVSVQIDGELRPLLWATVYSALFLALGLLLEHMHTGLPGWVVPVVYSLAYVTGGYLRVVEGLRALRQGSLNIDMLMVLGAVGAAALGRWSEGAVLIFLFALSNTLEEFAAGRTRRAIQALISLRPATARVIREGGVEEAVPVEALQPGDVVLIRPGEAISADGEVISGVSAVNQATITGESIPVEKGPGSTVFAGTINGSGLLTVRVERPAAESTISRIIRLVEEAQEHKAGTQRMADWIDRYYTLFVVLASLAGFLVPSLLMGWTWSDSFYLAMQLLVVMSPCALVIAVPAALLSSIAAAARRGILFKGGVHVEDAGRIRVVALDKTGTLTRGVARVQSLHPAPGVSEEELLTWAAAAEAHSGHPLAKAVVAAAQERGLAVPGASEVREEPGYGVTALVDGVEIRVGSRRLVAEQGWAAMSALADALENRGETAILVARGGQPLGIIGAADTLRPGVERAIQALRESGVERIVMLTGDNERVAAAIAARLGVDEFRANLLPEEKLEAVRQLQAQYGSVAMVGDGVNDAPALALADLGVAMGGAGNNAALESADVVLMSDDLARLPEAFAIGRQARRVMAQNLIFAVGVIITLVILTLSNQLTLPLAVVGHEGSTILVALNGMRMLLAGRMPEAARVAGHAPRVSYEL